MYKIIGNFLLFALFVCASATSAQAAAYASPQGSGISAAKKCVLTLNVSQTGPGQLTASWTTNGGGPFTVTLYDQNNNVLKQIVTNNLSWVFEKLPAGNYRVSVNQSPCVLISGLVAVV